MCPILVKGDSPNSASPPVTTFQSQAPCRKNIKINITTSNPLQPNTYSHHLHNVLAEATRQPIPPNPHPYLASPLGWMRLCNKTWSKNKLLISPHTKPVWPQSSQWLKPKTWLFLFLALEWKLHTSRNFCLLLYTQHLAQHIVHVPYLLTWPISAIQSSSCLTLLGDTSDTSSGKWVNTSKVNGEIWVKELCLRDHSCGTNCWSIIVRVLVGQRLCSRWIQ